MNNQESNNVKLQASVAQSLSGKYKLFVIGADEEVVWEQPDWQKNLILNQGMDALATLDYGSIMNNAFAGNGTRTNSISSGDSSGSISTSIFTLFPGVTGLQALTGSNSGYTNALEVGDMIKFNDSSEARVLAVSGISASVTPSTGVAQQPFTIWKTSQVGLNSPLHVVGTGNWFTGNQDGTYAGTTIVGNLQKNRRSWDFNYETSSVVFTEVGVGWGTLQSTVFSRVLLPFTQSIGVGQKLRLLYELDIAMYPTASSPGLPATASISGWPVAPSTDTGFYYNLQKCGVINGWVTSIATNAGADTRGCDPGVGFTAWVSNSSSSNANYDSATNRTSGWSTYNANMSTQTYTPLSFTLYRDVTFDVATAVRNDLRSMGVGNNWRSNGAADQYFSCVFNQNQTKTNIQTLSLTFVWNWGRVLA